MQADLKSRRNKTSSLKEEIFDIMNSICICSCRGWCGSWLCSQGGISMRINKAENLWWNVAVHGWPGPVMTVLLRTRRCHDERNDQNNVFLQSWADICLYGRILEVQIQIQLIFTKMKVSVGWRDLCNICPYQNWCFSAYTGRKYVWPRGKKECGNNMRACKPYCHSVRPTV